MLTSVTTRRRLAVVAGFMLASGAFVSSASATQDSAPAAASGELVVNISTPPATLDPSGACNLQDIALISDLYTTLVKYDTKGEGVNAAEDPTKLVGDLAKDWTVSADALTYTFNLREDAKFPSGKPIDSAAVKFSYDRAMAQTNSCGPYFAQAGQMPDGVVKSVETPSATQVVVTLTRPEPLYIHSLTQPNNGILDPSVIEANGGVEKSGEYLSTHSAGGGPYTVESYEPGTKLVLAANSAYYGDAPKRAKVTVNFITDPAALSLGVASADVTIGLPANAAADLKSDSTVQVVSTPLPAWEAVYLPTKSAPFDNAKFRAALAAAVPYQAILDKVAFGFGQTFFGPYPPALPGYTEANGAPIATDLEAAKKLAAEAGVSGDVPLEIIVREGVPQEEELATVLQSAWAELGVTVTVTKATAADYGNAITTADKKFAMIRNDGPAVQDPAWLLDYDAPCQSPYNVSNWCNDKAAELLKAAHAEADNAKRQAIWDQFAEVWRADVPRIPLYAVNHTAVLKAGMTSYRVSIDKYWFHTWG